MLISTCSMPANLLNSCWTTNDFWFFCFLTSTAHCESYLTNLQGLEDQGKILRVNTEKMVSQFSNNPSVCIHCTKPWIQLFKRELKENLGDFPNWLGEPQGKQNLLIPWSVYYLLYCLKSRYPLWLVELASGSMVDQFLQTFNPIN